MLALPGLLSLMLGCVALALAVFFHSQRGVVHRYLSSVTLSLAAFNLVPLPLLDGFEIASALLELVSMRGQVDGFRHIDSGPGGRWTPQRMIAALCAILISVVVVIGLWKEYRGFV